MKDKLSIKEGGHRYIKVPGHSKCSFRCGCWMGAYRSGGPSNLDPFGKCPNNIKLRDLSAQQLLSKYTSTVRRAWEEDKGHEKNPAHSSLYQKELSLKRELLRRLKGN